MLSSKKLTCKGTFRVYRLEMLVFSTALCELLPLCFNSPPSSLPCIQWGSGPPTDKHLPQSPFTGHFFTWWHFALLFKSLITVATLSHFTPQFFMLFLKHSVNESKSFICKHAAFDTWSHFCRCYLDMLSYTCRQSMQACIHAPGMQVWLQSCSQTCMEPYLHSARHEQPI
jgi:hypothetical protein